MTAAHASVENRLPPVTRKGYASWQSWISAFKAYCKTNCVGFRKRTSKSVEVYNRVKEFQRSLVAYRCKHGVHQERRGDGTRNTDVNFTGCLARFYLVLMDAVTLEKIFGYFKETNPNWTKIRSFVIDKHFVEWSVLEECFPCARVLLCQFHALTYWKKLIGSRFKLKLADQDTVQAFFSKMLYRYKRRYIFTTLA
eukprot:jgi/Phyca11/108653/e_gw1.15.512.1